MRGKASTANGKTAIKRITPAHAGKSETEPAVQAGRQDHPRTCGEKKKGGCREKSRLGSPPHMRGKAILTTFDAGKLRITPAHAGKRPHNLLCSLRRKDHPRTCGEKQFVLSQFAVVLGSPPHMRGKAFFFVPPKFCAGITPAHAGKRCCLPCLRCLDWDHPRTCGEKTKKIP